MMMRAFAGITLLALLSAPVFAQSAGTLPVFDGAGVHVQGGPIWLGNRPLRCNRQSPSYNAACNTQADAAVFIGGSI